MASAVWKWLPGCIGYCMHVLFSVLVALANGIRQSYVPSQGVRVNQTDCRVLQDQVWPSVVLLFRRYLCSHAKRGTLRALTTFVDVTYCNCQKDFTYEITMCCWRVSKCHCLSHLLYIAQHTDVRSTVYAHVVWTAVQSGWSCECESLVYDTPQ